MPPKRGDVIVFAFPEHPEQDFIKRVIAVGGDKLEAKNGHPWINGWEVPSCRVGPYAYTDGGPEAIGTHHEGEFFVEYLGEEAYLTFYDHAGDTFPEYQGPYVVPRQGDACTPNVHTCGADGKEPGQVWVMGDNRNNSHDSRRWFGGQGGGVPYENIRGRALFVWLSISDNGFDWSRLGAPVMGRPRLPKGLAPQIQVALDKCLADRPPIDKTTPPEPR
jgi:signal peptidase I